MKKQANLTNPTTLWRQNFSISTPKLLLSSLPQCPDQTSTLFL
jgi:hypothetical protein